MFLKLLKHPDNNKPHVAYYYLGRVYVEQGKGFWPKAKKSYIQSLRLRSDYENAMLALVKLYEAEGKREKAIGLASSFQERVGPKQRTARYLSVVYLERGDQEKALVQLRYLESFEKSNLNIKMKLALILIEKKDLKQAVYKLEEILAIAPESDKIRFYLAAVYEELGETRLSIENFIKVPSFSSYYLESVMHVASLYKRENRLDDSIRTVKRALEFRKDVPQLYTLYASLLNDRKDYKMAVATLLDAVKLFPKDTQLRFFLGTIFDRMGQTDLTIIQMNKVLEIDGNHVQALNYLAYTYAEQGGPLEEAERLARRALGLQPKDAYIMDTVGWVLFKRGQIAEAIRFLEAAHKTRPSESVVAEHLGDAYYQSELAEKAKQMYKKAVETALDDKKIQEIRTKITTIETLFQRTPTSNKKLSP